jgi:NAD(P)-dependent dehydrogenase (short-subunit alcohol dehydrogenase family)
VAQPVVATTGGARPVAVITGAARGIGLESARQLQATHRVALLDLDAAGAERAAAQLGGDAVWAACDIARADSVEAAVADVVDRCGGIDVAIANAGIATAGAVRHLDPEAFVRQLDVNLVGSWRFIHACLPHVVARRGYVLGVSSASALVAPPGLGFYASSKAGFEHLLDVLRVEVAHLGVDVGVAFFSWIDTDMVRGGDARHPAFAKLRADLRGPAGRTLPVAEAGAVIADAVAHRRRTVVAPRVVRLAYWLRGVIGPLLEREARRNGAMIDAATAEMVAERGAFDAAMGPSAPGAGATAEPIER